MYQWNVIKNCDDDAYLLMKQMFDVNTFDI